MGWHDRFKKGSPGNRAAAFTAMMVLVIPIVFSGVASADFPKQSVLPLDLAVKMAGAALKRCQEDGYRVSVAVADRSGVVKVLLRADGAGPHTVNSSAKKAYTSASLGRPTSELANMIKDKPDLQGLREMDERILILGGGLPIRAGDELIGGIGVGGAPGTQFDEACAKAGLEAIGEK